MMNTIFTKILFNNTFTFCLLTLALPLGIVGQNIDNENQEESDTLFQLDNPALAMIHNLEMTMDPTDTLPPSIQRMIDSYSVVQNEIEKSAIVEFLDSSWEERGPDNVGGRTRVVMYDPNDSDGLAVWAGAISGGLWFNSDITNADSKWVPIDDFLGNLAISSLTYDPNNTKTFYMGTGEGYYNADAVRGAGIWKSTDGGLSWQQLKQTNQDPLNFDYVQKIVVLDSGKVLASVRNKDHGGGVYFSEDGGNSWSLYPELKGPANDLEVASNGDIYASLGIFSKGKLFKSTDNGNTWKEVTPLQGAQRIEMALSSSKPEIIYAIGSFDTTVRWIQKSTNGGSSWNSLTIPRHRVQRGCKPGTSDFTRGQAWYNLTIAVHPSDPNLVFLGGIDILRSEDGGKKFELVSFWSDVCTDLPIVHADQHAFAFNPKRQNELIVGNDGGVYIIKNAKEKDLKIEDRKKGYNVTQFVTCAMKNEIGSNYFLAGAQDNGTQKFDKLGINSTEKVTGGDGGYCFIDKENDDNQISSYVFGYYYRSRDGGKNFQSISKQFGKRGRFVNPSAYDHKNNILYGAGNKNEVIRISNMDEKNPRPKLLSVDFSGEQVSSIRLGHKENRIIVGTGPFRRNGGGRLFIVDNAHRNPTVKSIKTPFAKDGHYISSIDLGKSDDHIIVTISNYGVKSVWETRDGGKKWSDKEGNLPDIPIRWVLVNPENVNNVMLATELGIWSTENIKAVNPKWEPLNNGLANVRCNMLLYRKVDNTIVVATHGRGLYTSEFKFSSN